MNDVEGGFEKYKRVCTFGIYKIEDIKTAKNNYSFEMTKDFLFYFDAKSNINTSCGLPLLNFTSFKPIP